jgi:RimJ/RimL family protein N-acetyltransferase
MRAVVAACWALGLQKLILRIIPGNARSASVARRFGFALEGTLRGEFLESGTKRVDVECYGRLAPA